jgi:hypothetical protein
MRLILSLLFSMIALVNIAQRDLEIEKFYFSPAPDWVIPVETPENTISKYEVSSGVYTLLADIQCDISEGADFMHYVQDVMTQGGVKNVSEFSISFDPHYQSVDFHYFYIYRNGKKLDRTDSLSFEKLNNETYRSSDNIYTGLITAFDILDDIRRGDRIEYAFTRTGKNPMFDGAEMRYYELDYNIPVGKSSIRVLYKPEENYIFKSKGVGKRLSSGAHMGRKYYHYVEENIEATNIKESIPWWYFALDYIVFAEDKKWSDVSSWAMQVFDLPTDLDFEALSEELGLDALEQEEKITRIIDFVQDDIRYTGLESGIGAIKPFPPGQTLERRFGDCKDKTVLLCTLLKNVGVEECYPALVNTNMHEGIEELIPNSHLFNHVIAYIKWNGEDYWVDPTNSWQGGRLDNMVQSDFGAALVVRPKEKNLSTMEPNYSVTKIDVVEEFDLRELEGPASLEVKSVLEGSYADNFRAYLEYYSIDDLEEELRAVYAPVFPKVSVSERLKIKDDLEANRMVITEYYKIEGAWSPRLDDESGNMVQFDYEPAQLSSYLSYPEYKEKIHPMGIAHPNHFTQETRFRLPEEIAVNPWKYSKSNQAFDYNMIIPESPLMGTSDHVNINYHFSTKSDFLSPENYRTYCDDMIGIVESCAYNFWFAKDKVQQKRELRKQSLKVPRKSKGGK